MAKPLNQTRPRSSISDMMPADVAEQATQAVQKQTATPLPERAGALPVVERPDESAATARTGEHTDIQKMYRLTPSAYRTLQQLRLIFSSGLGFDVPHSAVMRAVLYAVEQALPAIQRTAEELKPSPQPSTAIGNELARHALEHQLANVIERAFHTHRPR